MTESREKGINRKRKCLWLSLGLWLLIMSQYVGWKLTKDGNIHWTVSGTGFLLLISLLVSVILSLGLLALEEWISCRKAKGERKSSDASIGKLPGLRIYYVLALITMLLCWLPGYLAYYPGICAYDMPIQVGQIVSGNYGTHHPLAHTLLIGGFMNLGSMLGDVNTGIALYTAFQMICLAITFAAGITWLRTLGVKKFWVRLVWIYCCLFPFHWYMSITVTKDVFFTIFFLLQMICFCQLLHLKERSLRFCRWDIGYLLSTIGMILFRNNGMYALLVVICFLIVGCLRRHPDRKLVLRLLMTAIAGLVAGSLILSLLTKVTGAQQGDKREMLSLPIQQLARTMIYHGDVDVLPEDDATMDERDRQLINDFILDEGYREYRPDIADPVKRHTYTYVARYRAKEFLQTYLHLLAEYPGDYVNAALAVNLGYYYIGDISHAHINENGLERGLGYIQTRWVVEELRDYGIYKDFKWDSLHRVMEDYADQNGYLHTPVLRFIMIPGIYLWIYLFPAVFLWIRRRYLLLLPVTSVAGYYLTLVLGPTVQLRYLYPVMVAVPFLLLFIITEYRRENNNRMVEQHE